MYTNIHRENYKFNITKSFQNLVRFIFYLQKSEEGLNNYQVKI